MLKPEPYYRRLSGTSMAAPHVTGACALYKSEYSLATAAQIKNAILTAATQTPTASMTGKTITNGRLDVMKALWIAP
jgi:subtilisin family serine protease